MCKNPDGLYVVIVAHGTRLKNAIERHRESTGYGGHVVIKFKKMKTPNLRRAALAPGLAMAAA